MRARSLVVPAVVLVAVLTSLAACRNSNPAAPAAPTPPPATPTPEPTPVPCGDPLPSGLGGFRVKVHLRTGLFWTLDSTPIVSDRDYCRAAGFTDGRRECAVRPEGHPERASCEALLVGRAVDTGRPGPTWRRNGNLCTGIASGCENEPENQYQVMVYWQGEGDYTACAENGVCGTVFARGPY